MSHSLVTPSILKRQSTFPISYDYDDIEEEPGRLPPIKERKKRDERAAQGYLSTAGDLVTKHIADKTISQSNITLSDSFHGMENPTFLSKKILIQYNYDEGQKNYSLQVICHVFSISETKKPVSFYSFFFLRTPACRPFSPRSATRSPPRPPPLSQTSPWPTGTGQSSDWQTSSEVRTKIK